MKSNAMKMRQIVQNVARVNWKEFVFCAKPCGHLMCTFFIEEIECLTCDTNIDSKFAIFFQPCSNKIVLLSIDSSGIFRFGSDFRLISLF